MMYDSKLLFLESQDIEMTPTDNKMLEHTQYSEWYIHWMYREMGGVCYIAVVPFDIVEYVLSLSVFFSLSHL